MNQVEPNTTAKKHTVSLLYLVAVSSVAAIGGFLFGYRGKRGPRQKMTWEELSGAKNR